MWVPKEPNANEHAFQKRNWAHAANVAVTGCNEQCFDDAVKMESYCRELEMKVCCWKFVNCYLLVVHNRQSRWWLMVLGYIYLSSLCLWVELLQFAHSRRLLNYLKLPTRAVMSRPVCSKCPMIMHQPNALLSCMPRWYHAHREAFTCTLIHLIGE